MIDDFLWTEIHRPKCIDDTILPDRLKNIFKKFVKQDNVPNLLLTGSAGVGKTTIARAMLEEMDADYILINGSMSGNIDTLRYDIREFASTLSLTGKRKYVILDEADYLNANSTQPALRNFMEEYSSSCGFILTCNYKGRIIKELHSRCSVIDFKFEKVDRGKLAGEFFKRICTILDTEKVEYDQPVIVEIIKKFFPDFRRTLNELQVYSSIGRIDSGILANLTDESIKTLYTNMKQKNFTAVRKWAAENSDIETSEFYRSLYSHASNFLKTSAIPQLVLIIAKYQYQDAFVADREINTLACLVECMIDLEFV